MTDLSIEYDDTTPTAPIAPTTVLRCPACRHLLGKVKADGTHVKYGTKCHAVVVVGEVVCTRCLLSVSVS